VNAIMCPRTDITAVEYNSSYKDVISNIIESGFSRFPIYATTFDNIKGILYAKDILPYIDKPNNFRWQELLRSPYFVPETKKINVLLKELQTKKIHMAIVIDEYGGTSGLVTLEDILEEIVGEIIDESDEDEILYRKIDDNTYVFKGKVLLDDFIETLKLEEDPFEYVRGESETLAGLILQLTGVMPSVKQVVKFENFEFIIESTDARRITQVRVKINDGQKENQKESEDKKDEESK
ncbi:MAG: CBS domain-containing protein, partial [Bacteroidales bacterium]|nr:CBS domain-containing protein [Bacteroidales bacterium]